MPSLAQPYPTSRPLRTDLATRDALDLLELAATLCGAESCVDFELFARSKEKLLGGFLALERHPASRMP